MYQCPKCGHFVQWRAPTVYGAGYWICSQCGYSRAIENIRNTLTAEKEDNHEEQEVCAHTGA